MPLVHLLRPASWMGAVALCLALGALPRVAAAQVNGWGNASQLTQANTDRTPLPEEKAFQVEAITTENGTLVRLTPADGYYIYQAKTRFSNRQGQVLTGRWPTAEIHDDPHFGPTPIHRNQVEVPLSQKAGDTLVVDFQGCQDKGICYPPMQRTLNLSGGGDAIGDPSATPTRAAPADAPGTETAATPPKPQASTAPVRAQAEDQAWAERLAGKSWPWTLGAFFLVGLGLSLTPCVLPMVPIVLGIVAPAHAQGRGGLGLASLYVLAHALVLAAVGALGASLGGGAGLVQQLQTPLWLSVAAIMFILLGAWQAGWVGHGVGARATQSLQTWLGQIPQGRAWGALALGAGSALVLGPCVAPATAGALLYVANEGSVGLGAGALFAMGLGMGVPMLLLSAGGQRLLPSAGAWMEHMTKAGAMGLLGVAAILLDRATGQQWQMAWLAAWSVASASLWAKPVFAPHLKTAAAAASVMLLVVGLQSPKTEHVGAGLVFETVSASQLRERMAQGEPIVLDLSADWCTSCLTMEKTTFADMGVADAARGMNALRLNLDEIDEEEKAFLKEHGLIGPPAILFFDQQGQERRSDRLVGPEGPEPFAKRLRDVSASLQG